MKPATKKAVGSSGPKKPAKRTAHRVKARIDHLSDVLKSAVDEVIKWRAQHLGGMEDFRGLPPALFDACMVYAVLITERLNRPSVQDLNAACKDWEAGHLVVDMKLLTVSRKVPGKDEVSIF